MNTILIPGPVGALAIEEVGWTKTPLVLLHGLGGNASHWNPVVKALQPRRTITIDLRGHGRSSAASPDDFGVEAHARDVLAVAEARGLGRFALAGHSFGGAVALEAAAMAPSRIAAVYTIDAPLFPDADSAGFVDTLTADALRELWLELAGDDARVRRRVLKDLGATSPELVIAGFRALFAWKAGEALARWAGPARALASSEADVVGLGGSWSHRVVGDGGHWMHLTCASAVGADLDAFLAKVD